MRQHKGMEKENQMRKDKRWMEDEVNNGAYVFGIVMDRDTYNANKVPRLERRKLLYPALDVRAQPFETLIQTIARCSACSLR